jgi:sodium-dependent dicarboxylate transporter 2/3/5
MGKYAIRKIGFLVGIIVFIIMLAMPTPEGLTPIAQKVLASTVLMVIFWVTEAIPIAMTSYLPLIVFPIISLTGSKGQNDIQLFSHYAYTTVYLLVGVGFLSGAMVKWNLHKRIALGIVRKVGAKPKNLILGFILAVAFVSMWMSNTTATVMMIPVALSITAALKDTDGGFKKALVLSIPFAATIGGIGTVIGTTTNPTGIGLIRETIGLDITFTDWLKIGLPFVIVIVPILWIYMVKFFKVDKMKDINVSAIDDEYHKLGPMSKGEKFTAYIFLFAIVAWMTRSQVWGKYIPFATDETIAMFAALLTIIIPVNWKEGEYLMDMKTAIKEIPWSACILLGGSMVMGNAFKDSGCAAWIAGKLGGLAGLSPLLIVIIVGVVTAIITELTTNAVVVAAFLPVLASVGTAIGVNPLAMMLACMLSCNFAFMLPPATPPNAVAYGTGEIEMADLIKCGLGLKIICLIIFPIIIYGITMGVFGFGV